MKLHKVPDPRTRKVDLRGSPLSAFTHAFYYIVGSNYAGDYDGIKLFVSSVELADAVDSQSPEDENAQLIRAWRSVCWAAGGVFDYIRERGIEVNDRLLEIIVDPENLFAPNCVALNVETGTVSVASANKKLSKISFDLSRTLGGKLIREPATKFEWSFSLSDGWNRAFDGISVLYEQWTEEGIDSCLPIFWTLSSKKQPMPPDRSGLQNI